MACLKGKKESKLGPQELQYYSVLYSGVSKLLHMCMQFPSSYTLACTQRAKCHLLIFTHNIFLKYMLMGWPCSLKRVCSADQKHIGSAKKDIQYATRVDLHQELRLLCTKSQCCSNIMTPSCHIIKRVFGFGAFYPCTLVKLTQNCFTCNLNVFLMVYNHQITIFLKEQQQFHFKSNDI